MLFIFMRNACVMNAFIILLLDTLTKNHSNNNATIFFIISNYPQFWNDGPFFSSLYRATNNLKRKGRRRKNLYRFCIKSSLIIKMMWCVPVEMVCVCIKFSSLFLIIASIALTYQFLSLVHFLFYCLCLSHTHTL